MKKLLLTLLLVLQTVSFAVFANPVDVDAAREIGAKFLKNSTKMRDIASNDLSLVKTYHLEKGEAAFYIFNTDDGFVIVSADECATPILAYSYEGQFDENNLPVQFEDYLNAYVEQIQYGVENDLASDETTIKQWELIRSTGRLNEQRNTNVVEPLLTETWHQNCYYNALCPVDETSPACQHVYAGCVATAMGQIMHYWQYPETGNGSHTYTYGSYPTQTADFGSTTYDWANMPDFIDANSSDEEIEAVALLLWHCGVAVDMQYGPDGSGAYSSDVPYALINYFKYSNEMEFDYRSNYNNQIWKAKLRSNLDMNRPLYYSGSRGLLQGGHAFVCDGYDANDLFHFNFGWSGSSNAYCAIGAVLNYNYNDAAIFNIHPQSEPTYYDIIVSANNEDDGFVSGGGSFAHGSTVTVSAVANSGYDFCYWDENGGIASSDANYTFSANYNRNLKAMFSQPLTITATVGEGNGTVSEGGTFHYGETCTLVAAAAPGYIFDKWTKDDEFVSGLSTYAFSVTFATEGEYIAHFIEPNGVCIGEPETTSPYIPSYSYYKYGLTQQIYIAAEIGAGSIHSIAFYNAGYQKTRNYNIYLKTTDKDHFNSSTDWIPVTEEDKVFNGNATMTKGTWTTFELDNVVTLDGNSNLLVVVDDNTGSYTSNHMQCRAFSTISGQALYVYGNNTNYDPQSSYNGTISYVKNQILLNIDHEDSFLVNVTKDVEEAGEVSGGGEVNYGETCTVTAIANEGYTFHYWMEHGKVLSMDSEYSFVVRKNFNIEAVFSDDAPISFVDSNVKSVCVNNWDTNSDGELSYNEAAAVSALGTVFKNNTSIQLFDELIYFTGLTAIDYEAFRGCSNLKSIVIPDNINAIENYAFYYCNSLTAIDIPDNVNTIGNYAFYYCYGLTSLKLSSSLTSIGYYAFYNCNKLKTLEIPSAVTVIENNVFDYNNLESITVVNGNGVYDSRENCNAIIETATNTLVTGCKNTVIPNSINAIGNYAFNSCIGLTSLEIPDGITSIGINAFYHCGLTMLEIPASVISIGGNAFGYNSLLSISVADGNTVYDSRENCNAIIETETNTLITGCKNTVIPNSITEIGDNAFYYNTGLSSIEIPDGVVSLGIYAFYFCTGLTSLHIPASVSSLNTYSLYYCTGLTSITMDSDIPPTVGNYALYGINQNVLLTVPCGSVSTYQNASGWSGFTNYYTDDNCTHVVTAIPNLEAGGSVEGAGTYVEGRVCTLKASPAEYYRFMGWTCNDEIVSTNETYSFNVTEDRNLIAVFELEPINYVVASLYPIYNNEASPYVKVSWLKNSDVSFNFENGMQGWTSIDADGDSYHWTSTGYTGHNGGKCVSSASYINDVGAITPDNYLVSPKKGFYSQITFWACAQDGAWAAEHFGVAVSTTGNTDADDFTTIQEWDLARNSKAQGAWYQYSVDLSAYQGQDIWVAIRHFTSTDMFYINVDDVELIAQNNGKTVQSYNLYRTDAHNNTVLIVQNTTEHSYIDDSWETLPYYETYSYGVAEIDEHGDESELAWSNVIERVPAENHWTPITGNQYNMNIIGVITINGEEQFNSTLEVGAFCGDECRGSVFASFFQPTAQYLVPLTVVSNVESGETITFRLYDHIAKTERDDLTCSASVVFENDAVIGTVGDLFQFSFNNEHFFDLMEGWNWWSTYVEQDNVDALLMLENSLGHNGSIIKSQTATVVNYYPQTDDDVWFGDLEMITNENGYLVKTNNACTISLYGETADVDNHPITINPMWSWIGYPVDIQQNIAVATSNLLPEENDLIKGQNTSAIYAEGYGWFPQDFVMKPGQSYKYKSLADVDKTFTYVRSDANTDVVPMKRYWNNDGHAFADNMTLIASVFVADVEQRDANLELGAFVNGVCRGSAKLNYFEPLDRYYAMLTISGEKQEEVEFALVNADMNKMGNDSKENITFVSDAVIGNLNEPFEVHFGEMSDINRSELVIYPNPVNRFEAYNLNLPKDEMLKEIQITDAVGSVVSDNIRTLTVSGIYIVKAICVSGNVYIGKLIVK